MLSDDFCFFYNTLGLISTATLASRKCC